MAMEFAMSAYNYSVVELIEIPQSCTWCCHVSSVTDSQVQENWRENYRRYYATLLQAQVHRKLQAKFKETTNQVQQTSKLSKSAFQHTTMDFDTPLLDFDTPLSTEDIKEVLSLLYPAQDKYYNLGIQLDVSVDKLQKIQADNTDQLREMLIRRLSDVKPICWNDIFVALSDVSVDKKKLASDIKKKLSQSKVYTKVNSGTIAKLFSRADFWAINQVHRG